MRFAASSEGECGWGFLLDNPARRIDFFPPLPDKLNEQFLQ
jgi:hypothetical protein